MTVKRKDIVADIALKTGLPNEVVKEVMEGVFESILSGLEEGKRIELRDFGVFSVRVTKARMALNPNDLAPVPVPEKARPRFKPAKAMIRRTLNARPQLDESSEPDGE